MKTRILLFVVAFFSFLISKAEDELQAVPFTTQAGLTPNDAKCFQINLNNSQPVWGVQFELKLPKGLILDQYPYEIVKDRFPSIRGNLLHGVFFNTVDEWTITTISPDDENSVITGNTGNILNVYYSTDSSLPEGIYPIEIRNALIIYLDGSVKLANSTSYCYVGESPIKTQKDVNLSCLTNNIPSFVMDAVNTDLAVNAQAQSLDLTGMTNFEKAPVLSNPNALCYITANTAAATKLDATKAANIIKKDADTYTCSQLTLNEAYPFHCDQEVKVDKASLVRNPLTAQWNTLCLPFDLSQEQLVATFGEGTYVQDFTNFENNSLYFNTDATGYSANQPSLLYVAQPKTAQQYDFGAVTLQPTTAQPAISFNGATFKGNYDGNISATGYFGVTPDSKVMIGGSKATLNGFKACFELPSTVNVQKLNINHGDVTGVETVGTVTNESNVYSLNGTLLMENAEKEEVIRHLPKGIYIINNKKVIVK